MSENHQSTTRRRILITGATGNVGTELVKRLSDDYEIVQQGRHADSPEQEKAIEKVGLDEYHELVKIMDGVDSVIHLAGSASPESSWEDVLESNIIGFRNTLEAAREAGVRRFIFASSNHAMGGYDRAGDWPVYPHFQHRGDSLYGVSKGFGELLGRFYHEKFGIDFLALRIGWLSGDPFLADADILHAMWLSPADCAQAVKCAIEAEVTFGQYYVISDNPNRRWDLTNTMLDLGYRPQDTFLEHADGEPEEVVEGGIPAPKNWPEDS